MGAGNPLMLHRMRAQLLEQPLVRSFGEIIIVHRPQHRAKAIGINRRIAAAIGILRFIAQRLALADLDLALEQSGRVDQRQFADRLAIQRLRADVDGVGQQHAGGKAGLAAVRIGRMHAKRREGIGIAPFDQPVDLLRRQHAPISRLRR